MIFFLFFPSTIADHKSNNMSMETSCLVVVVVAVTVVIVILVIAFVSYQM